MTQLTIWGRTNSINVQKVLWLCEDIQLPFERINAGMEHGVNKTDEYKAKNPNGLVPTINDNGFILWESHSILRYIARKYDAPASLYPNDLQICGRIDQWLDWYNTVGWPPMRNLFWGWIRTPEPDRNVQDLEKIRLQFMGLIEMIENQLSNTTYIAGEHFTIADIPMALLFYRWFNLPLERPVYEQVNRWYALVQQRPGFQKYSSDPLS